ncbi:hypothetical protein ACFX4N_23835 [Priestia sp. YIM B13551]|uniref:hypothetical protein n=1 Tax=Priestia sp. YIM B13551 TaxID=3366306 RepID=UPI00366E7B9D
MGSYEWSFAGHPYGLQTNMKWRVSIMTNNKMTGKEIKALEVQVAKAMGLDKVSLVRSEDYKAENKVVELPNMQQPKKEGMLTRFGKFMDATLDKMENPSKIKLVDKALDFFFPESKEVEYEIEGHYEHHKMDTEKEGNVVYLSRDFKNKK